MFLNAVVLILQEILEASLLIGVLLALTDSFHRQWDQRFKLSRSWVAWAMSIGLLCAWLFARFTPVISEWFDYAGQEVINSMFHVISLLGLVLLAFAVPANWLQRTPLQRSRLTRICMVMIVLLSLVREGSEILIYLGGVTGDSTNLLPVLAGAAIGAGIGLSCGVFLYYALTSLNSPWTLRSCVILLALLAGNMASQVVMLLSQVDWLPYTAIAWNTGSLIPENSIPGHLLYALIGYEATPSILQASCYFAGIALLLLSPLFRQAWLQRAGGTANAG